MAGAAVTVVLWALTSLVFSLAVSAVLDYGRTYGSLGAPLPCWCTSISRPSSS